MVNLVYKKLQKLNKLGWTKCKSSLKSSIKKQYYIQNIFGDTQSIKENEIPLPIFITLRWVNIRLKNPRSLNLSFSIKFVLFF